MLLEIGVQVPQASAKTWFVDFEDARPRQDAVRKLKRIASF